MSEMVEQVAMALARELHGKPDNESPVDLRDVARAAIAAMREPTDEMVKAVDRLVDVGDPIPTRGAWRAMIDAALRKTPD